MGVNYVESPGYKRNAAHSFSLGYWDVGHTMTGAAPVAIKCPLHLSRPTVFGWPFSRPMGGSTSWQMKLICPESDEESINTMTAHEEMILKTCTLHESNSRIQQQATPSGPARLSCVPTSRALV